MESEIHCASALLPDRWARDVTLSISADGDITDLRVDSEPATGVSRYGAVLPGMPNLHSHAFQRAMAGLGETAGPGEDSFWSWRRLMYQFLGKIGPEELEVIAEFLYVEMLKAGYTSVAEFHYLHHGPDGSRYAQPAEMSLAIVRAARRAGIALTLLPVYYARGGFGGQAPEAGQRRFLHDEDGYLELMQALRSESRESATFRLGAAFHSLRAVTPEELQRLVEELGGKQHLGPVHIHIAEQEREVADCIAWSGQRPVAWLLDHAEVDRRWCLIHATHMDSSEARAVAMSGAVAGLCPSTEANLGDGLFPADAYIAAGGRYGVGSDSHVSVSPSAELRLLEYGQRLRHRGRNRLASGPACSTGGTLYRAALQGGAQALDRPAGAIAVGMKADLIMLDSEEPMFAGK